MSKFIYRFHITGMNGSEGVSAARNSLSAIPGVAAVNVNLQKMQAEITTTCFIRASVLKDALSNMNLTLSHLAVKAAPTSAVFRDDENE